VRVVAIGAVLDHGSVLVQEPRFSA
jgi:hypothetical protein